MVSRIFDDGARNVRGSVAGIYVILTVANAAAWLWAFLSFHSHPVLPGTALLGYGFGLRHAVDADHIAAIDNVTRKLMQDGKRPVAAWHHRRTARAIERGQVVPATGLVIFVGGLVAFLAAVMIIYLVLSARR